MNIKDIRLILGTKKCILLDAVDSKDHCSLTGLYSDVNDDVLQFMFDNGFEFVEYRVNKFMGTLEVILIKPKRKRVRRP